MRSVHSTGVPGGARRTTASRWVRSEFEHLDPRVGASMRAHAAQPGPGRAERLLSGPMTAAARPAPSSSSRNVTTTCSGPAGRPASTLITSRAPDRRRRASRPVRASSPGSSSRSCGSKSPPSAPSATACSDVTSVRSRCVSRSSRSAAQRGCLRARAARRGAVSRSASSARSRSAARPCQRASAPARSARSRPRRAASAAAPAPHSDPRRRPGRRRDTPTCRAASRRRRAHPRRGRRSRPGQVRSRSSKPGSQQLGRVVGSSEPTTLESPRVEWQLDGDTERRCPGPRGTRRAQTGAAEALEHPARGSTAEAPCRCRATRGQPSGREQARRAGSGPPRRARRRCRSRAPRHGRRRRRPEITIRGGDVRRGGT